MDTNGLFKGEVMRVERTYEVLDTKTLFLEEEKSLESKFLVVGFSLDKKRLQTIFENAIVKTEK